MSGKQDGDDNGALWVAFGVFFPFLFKHGRSLVCDKQPPSTTKLPARAGIMHGLCAAGGAQEAEHLLLRRREAKEAARKLMSVTLRGSAALVNGVSGAARKNRHLVCYLLEWPFGCELTRLCNSWDLKTSNHWIRLDCVFVQNILNQTPLR